MKVLLMGLVVTALTSSPAMANDIMENWQVLGPKAVSRLNTECEHFPVSQQAALGLSSMVLGSVSLMAGGALVPDGGMNGAMGVITIAAGAASIGSGAMSYIQAGDKMEFLGFIDDLQNGLDTARVEKFRTLAKASNVPFGEALRGLNELVRSQDFCVATVSLKTLEKIR